MAYWRKPLDADRVTVVTGQVVVLSERCKGCGFCVEFCPREVLALSKEFNSKGYHPPYTVRQEQCVDCRLCETLCPEFAIYLRR
jgi:2-oxoglutarate ferredoxin oxidoreductase subunit delta